MTDARDETPPEGTEKLLRLLGGKWVAAAISAAASLGVADALDVPRTAEQLAAMLQCDADRLDRLLRVLAGEGLLHRDRDDRFSLTATGAALRADALGPLATYVGSPSQWGPWAELAPSIRGGASAFERFHGADLFTYLDGDANASELYHTAVDAFTRRQARALTEAFDFGPYATVADIGGGLGTLLVEVLTDAPHLQGVLFDRPSVVAQAEPRIADSSVAGRVRFEGGSFLETVPGEADVYVVKHVIHNWADEEAARILCLCAENAGPDGRVLVIEGLLLPGNRRDATRLLDLEMLALCGGGHERSKPEMRRLFASAGLRLESAAPLLGGTRLLVGVPRG